MNDKKMVRVAVTSLTSDLDGPIDDAIALLQGYKERYPNSVLDYTAEDYDENFRIYLLDERMETDEEYEERVKKEKVQKEVQLAYKRIQLERLKKELGEE